MNITADTNVLLRAVLEDDITQAAAAQALLAQADTIAVPVPVLCEFVWVLKRGYRYGTDDIAAAVEAVCELDAVVTDHPAVQAGLAALRAGGDFADGVIAAQGMSLGGATFASFDRDAVAALRNDGTAAADPSTLVAEAAPPDFRPPDRP